ncbi:MAG TPA: twin-arginine translocase TatA/TatE family subunit [Anaerolineae bacterium]|nr:twin-arginine translocase TatA/TatE family subunit [Anaerolineae bacterium]
MPDIGVPELLIILVIVVILFGADRLTDVMKALGQGVAEFRKGMREGTNPNEDNSKKV